MLIKHHHHHYRLLHPISLLQHHHHHSLTIIQYKHQSGATTTIIALLLHPESLAHFHHRHHYHHHSHKHHEVLLYTSWSVSPTHLLSSQTGTLSTLYLTVPTPFNQSHPLIAPQCYIHLRWHLLIIISLSVLLPA